jgi:hypothetical protein
MGKVLDPELEKKLTDGIDAIRGSAPTTQQDRDELLAALAELQLKKQQANCIGFGRFKATGPVTFLIVIAAAAVLYFALPYVADIIRAAKAGKAQAAQAERMRAELPPLEVPSK